MENIGNVPLVFVFCPAMLLPQNKNSLGSVEWLGFYHLQKVIAPSGGSRKIIDSRRSMFLLLNERFNYVEKSISTTNVVSSNGLQLTGFFVPRYLYFSQLSVHTI